MQIVSKSMQLFLWMLMPLMGIVSKWTALDKKRESLETIGRQSKEKHTHFKAGRIEVEAPYLHFILNTQAPTAKTAASQMAKISHTYTTYKSQPDLKCQLS